MLRKYASLVVLDKWLVDASAGRASLRRHAHRVAFDYEPRPGYLYVRSRMISSRTNDNHDTFPASEIEKGYKTFLGKPVFVNHHNANHRRARGVIVAVALHRDRNPDRTPDTWVEGLMEIDALRFPKLAQAILAGKVNRTSMGVDVEESTCSHCANKATSPAEYCRHIPGLKGKKARKRNQRTGKVEEKLIHEVCAGLSFFENSLLVEEPADPTAYFLGKPDARGLQRAARRRQAGTVPEPWEVPSAVNERFPGAKSCTNCGTPFSSPGAPGSAVGDWRNMNFPHLCNDCAIGHVGNPSEEGKPPSLEADLMGGMGTRSNIERMQRAMDEGTGGLRGWTPDDALKHSTSSKTAAAGRDPDPGEPPSGKAPHPRSLEAQYPNPADHPFFQAHPMHKNNIKASYNDSNDNEKSLGDRWYPDAHHIAKAITTTKERPEGHVALGAGLLSTYSPQTAWPVNLFNASRAARGEPPGPGSGAMGSQQRPAIKMLAGKHHSEVLNSPKTRDFAHLIEHGGDTESDTKTGSQRVVIDRHALSVAAGRRLHKDEVQGFPASHRHFYEHVAQHYRDAARELSAEHGRTIHPHQVQATTWLRQVRKNQEEDRAGEGKGGLGAGRGRVQMHTNSQERWMQHHREHHQIHPENMHFNGVRKLAYGETRVPAQVDTLRMEECPVCGEHDVWSGDRCPVCGFIVPPSLFRDPDTSKASEVRDQLDQSGEVTTQPGEPGDPSTQPMGSDPDADAQLMHPDQVAPDGVPAVQGGDGQQQPMDPAAQVPGKDDEIQGEAEEEQGEEDAEMAQQEQAEGQELANEGEEEQLDPQGSGALVCPECGTTFAPDMAAQPGVPCPACRQGSLEPAGGPPEGAEDPSEETEDEDEEKQMPDKTAAALAQAQARRIAELTAQNEVLEAQLGFLARAAGVDQELAKIGARVMQRHADVLNPASPVPDPPEEACDTTEQTLAPDAMDDPSRPGTTPNSVEAVPAAQTTTAITPGVELQTPPATNLVDVTAPVQGTNPSQDGGVPLEQRRIETDVRIDPDPLKAHGPGVGGQGDNGTAFPWTLQGRPDGQKAAAKTSDDAARTYGSLRLARLRITAGLAQGEDVVLAEQIRTDARLSTDMIAHEIEVLSQVRPAAPQPRMPRQAVRQAPSLASVGAGAPQYANAASADDDASDLFI